MVKFRGKIFKIGINPVIDPPPHALKILFEKAGRSKGPIPVSGKLNGAEFVQTLVKYAGDWRLYINAGMLGDSGLQVGDFADVEIEYDPRPRDVPVPRLLADALRKDKDARIAFDRLAPSRRKEIYRYLGSLKTDVSIRKNIDRFISHLLDRETDAQYALMRRKKPE